MKRNQVGATGKLVENSTNANCNQIYFMLLKNK